MYRVSQEEMQVLGQVVVEHFVFYSQIPVFPKVQVRSLEFAFLQRIFLIVNLFANTIYWLHLKILKGMFNKKLKFDINFSFSESFLFFGNLYSECWLVMLWIYLIKINLKCLILEKQNTPYLYFMPPRTFRCRLPLY